MNNCLEEITKSWNEIIHGIDYWTSGRAINRKPSMPLIGPLDGRHLIVASLRSCLLIIKNNHSSFSSQTIIWKKPSVIIKNGRRKIKDKQTELTSFGGATNNFWTCNNEVTRSCFKYLFVLSDVHVLYTFAEATRHGTIFKEAWNPKILQPNGYLLIMHEVARL